jgi:hypothetical protein
MLLKSADQDLDLARLMFAIAHPSMFRRLCFSMQEQHPDNYHDGYGSPYDLAEEYRGDIHLPCMGWGDDQWSDTEYAKAWIVKNLNEQGVKVTLEK